MTDRVIQEAARVCNADTDCTGAGEHCFGHDADAGIGGECVGGACTADSDCYVCQTCSVATGKCIAPDPASTCLLNGGPGTQVQ